MGLSMIFLASMNRIIVLLSSLALAACSDTPPSPVPPVSSGEQVVRKQSADQVETSVPAPKKPSAKPTVKLGQITGVEIGQLFTLQQAGKVHLIDVRPPLYFRLGHIDGAVNFPLIKYDARLAEQLPLIEQALASGKTVVLYCQNLNCPDAYKTAQKLVKLGHSVSVYKGGWEEWKKSGL